jgi:anti-sigma factor RsiW
MPTCKDVATAIGQDDVRTLPWWRGLALRLHLLMCPHCRRYAAQIRAIGTAARRLFREHGEDPQTLERLHETILGRRD